MLVTKQLSLLITVCFATYVVAGTLGDIANLVSDLGPYVPQSFSAIVRVLTLHCIQAAGTLRRIAHYAVYESISRLG
jgi:hypothetical protein